MDVPLTYQSIFLNIATAIPSTEIDILSVIKDQQRLRILFCASIVSWRSFSTLLKPSMSPALMRIMPLSCESHRLARSSAIMTLSFLTGWDIGDTALDICIFFYALS